jgi:hypothetical protein
VRKMLTLNQAFLSLAKPFPAISLKEEVSMSDNRSFMNMSARGPVLALGRKYLIHGIDFYFGLMEDSNPCGGRPMKASRLPRKTAHISDSLHRQLNMYAMAASAAGVSLLALAPPSEAEIIYTKAHVVLGARSDMYYALDLNHDKIVDFYLFHRLTYSQSGNKLLFSSEVFVPQNTQVNKLNRVALKSENKGPLAFRAGDKIGPSVPFWYSGRMAAARGTAGEPPSVYLGNWANHGEGLKNRYLGFRFAIKNKAHYGWARVSVSQYPFAATLTGYAYETIPGKAIIAGATKGPDDPEPTASLNAPAPAPEPATLGTLALGAPGLSIWRRKESAAAALAAN